MHKRHAFELTRVTVILIALVISWIVGLPIKVHAATGLTLTNGAGGQGTNGWTNPANAQGTADNNVYATSSPANNATVNGIWNTYNFDSNLPINAKITNVKINAQYKTNNALDTVTLSVQAMVGGSPCPGTAVADTSGPTSDTTFVADVTSCRSWARGDLLNTAFGTQIGAKRSGLFGVNFSLDFVTVTITYDMPDYNQSAYRWFDNNNSTDVGPALAAQNTGPTLYAPRDRVRLRMLVHVTTTTLFAGGETFKLQIAQKTAACSTLTYADVNGSTAFAPFDNSSPADGSTLTTNANDPTHASDTKITEKYTESNPASTASNVGIGQDGLWDFSLVGTAGAPNTTYCFRLVAGTAAFTTYTTYPEITTSSAGSLNTDIVDASGISVGSPSFGFSSLIVPVVCGSTTATIGTAAQKLRLKNTTDDPSWTVSIAATGGATALWSDGGTNAYDYNDSGGSPGGCSDSGDPDSKGGQLTINPSVSTVTPRPVCSGTGISKGSSSAFSEGSINAITLLNSSAGTDAWCYWDVTGISASQQIPGGQLPGSYSLNLTLTVVAN